MSDNLNRPELNLYVIERESGGELQYWTSSTEHGCGWVSHVPKQAWSKSEVANEIRKLAEAGHWTDVEVRQLAFVSDFYLARNKWYGCRDDVERYREICLHEQAYRPNAVNSIRHTPPGTLAKALDEMQAKKP